MAKTTKIYKMNIATKTIIILKIIKMIIDIISCIFC